MPDKATAVPEPAARNIEAIAALEREALSDQSGLDRITAAATAAAGSPLFMVAQAVFIAGWIAFNLVGGRTFFDPYPFGLLVLIVSIEAIFLSVTVLMTQNRMQRQADKRAHLDLQINLLAEQELTTILKMVAGICKHLDITLDGQPGDVDQMIKDTDIQTIAAALDRELTEAPSESVVPTARR